MKEIIEKLIIVLILTLFLYVLIEKLKTEVITEQKLETMDSLHRFKLVPAGSIQKVDMGDSTITFTRFRIIPIGSAADSIVYINIKFYLDKDSL